MFRRLSPSYNPDDELYKFIDLVRCAAGMMWSDFNQRIFIWNVWRSLLVTRRQPQEIILILSKQIKSMPKEKVHQQTQARNKEICFSHTNCLKIWWIAGISTEYNFETICLEAVLIQKSHNSILGRSKSNNIVANQRKPR